MIALLFSLISVAHAQPAPMDVPGALEDTAIKADPKAAPGSPAAESPAQQQQATNYQPIVVERDPFKRPIFVDVARRPRTELEYFPTEQYKMVGVLTGPERLRAMVLGPNGKTYFVAENTKIGVRQGAVRRITAHSIVVREKVLNVLGKEENVDTEIRLPGDPRY